MMRERTNRPVPLTHRASRFTDHEARLALALRSPRRRSMTPRSLFSTLAAGSAVLLAAGAAQAAPRAEDRELLAKVSQRLLAAAEAPEGYAWPPRFTVVERAGPLELNAFASAAPARSGAKPEPYVEIDTAMMEQVVQGDPDRLAYIMGHELSHLLLGH